MEGEKKKQNNFMKQDMIMKISFENFVFLQKKALIFRDSLTYTLDSVTRYVYAYRTACLHAVMFRYMEKKYISIQI